MVIQVVVNKKRQVDEIRRCARDPVYFFNTYCRISHPVRGPVPFKTYPFQDECTQVFNDAASRFVIVNKSRQLGLSTLTAAYALWYVLFRRNKEVLIIATKLKTAQNFIRKVKFILKNLPKWLVVPTVTGDNKTTLEFGAPSNSKIEAVPTSVDAGRSEALSLLIVDEAAHIRDFAELWKGLYPTLTTGGRAIVISTPKGHGNHFHELWSKGQAGANEFKCIELPWTVHPEHDQAWFDKETKNMDRAAIAQEMMCVGGEVRIITPCGFKLASDINVGDQVLTHKGRFKKVLTVNKRLADPAIEQIFQLSTPLNRQSKIVITGNHPVLGAKIKQSNGSFGAIQKRGLSRNFYSVNELAEHEHVQVTNRSLACLFPVFSHKLSEELDQIDLSTLIEGSETIEDSVRYPRQWGSNKRFVPVDYDLGRFLGLWLADGYAHPNNRFGFGFGFHVEEYDTLRKFVDDYLARFGVKTRSEKASYANSCRIDSHNQFFVQVIRKLTKGLYANDKKLNMDVVLLTNIDFVRGVLVGYFEGDGIHHPTNKLTTVSTHSELLYQMRTLLSMFGYYPRLGHSDGHPTYIELCNVKGKKLDELIGQSTPIEKCQSRTRLIDGCFMGHPRFDLLDDIEPLWVYNFEVEDDHTYVADSIVVHNCDFLASGETFLLVEEIEWIGQTVRKALRRDGPDMNVWVWADPIRDDEVKYILSGDCASGRGNDFSAFHIINATLGEIVAEYKGKIQPDHFAEIINTSARRYNNALVCIERNSGWGQHANTHLIKHCGYTHIYFDNKKHPIPLGDYIPHDMIPDAGFDTSPSSRPKILAKMEEIIRSKQIRIYSSRLYDELKSFVMLNNKPQAQKNCNDDLVLALAIGLWIFDVSSVNSQFATKLNSAMLQGFGRTSNDFSNMAGNGNEVLPKWTSLMPYVGGNAGPNNNRNRPKRDDHTDMSWLLGK